MKRTVNAIVFGAIALLVTATAAEAQLWGFPDYALPSGGTTAVGGSYGRGLNDDSGKSDAYGAFIVGSNGSGVSFAFAGAMISDIDDELTLGGAVGYDVSSTESMTISVQGGVGWMGPGNLTLLRIPVGVAFKGQVDSGEAVITPWAMPRINISRLSGGGFSDTETDFGGSAGVSFNFSGGFGIHTALDVLITGDDSTPITFGAGGHYVIGGGN